MPGALLLLLAVAAGLTDLCWCATLNPPSSMSIADCSISYYGDDFPYLHISQIGSKYKICFMKDPSHPYRNCMTIVALSPLTTVDYSAGSVISAGSVLHQQLTGIAANDSLCSTELLFKSQGSSVISVTLISFGSQAAVKFTTFPMFPVANVKVEMLYNQRVLGTFNYPKSDTNGYVDISGCIAPDGPVAPGTVWENQNTCSNSTCRETTEITKSSTCERTEECLGISGCVPRFVCSVTGSTVSDFFGRVQSVPDRCLYELLKAPGNFTILAGFQERRRQDVPFLDYLTIKIEGNNYMAITLGQGGSVEIDDVILDFKGTHSVQNVMISKDQTGVTVKMPSFKTNVFFDGYTAHVTTHDVGPWGMCGNTADPSVTYQLSAVKSSQSPNGCDDVLTGDHDSQINCNSSTEHCELLNQGHFLACHNYTDPAPYITACTNTLCNYPQVDGLRCQFLEAYAKACYLKAGITLPDWRSDARCPADSAAFCPDRYCSRNEFCGNSFGHPRCLCRAVFASKYKPTNSLGEPTVCRQSSATVVLAACLLEEYGIDYSTLHLQDENCKGEMDGDTHMVTFQFNNSNCGTEIVMNNSQIIYQNAIILRNSSSSDVITRSDQVNIDFSCIYRQPGSKIVAFKIMDGSVVQQLVFGVWNYTLRMNAYTDAARFHLVKEDTEIHLNQKVWLELKTEKLEGNMIALVTDSCWATSQESSASLPKYDLIIAGCPNPNDNTVKVEGNGRGTSNYFSFNMFQFSGKDGQIYLHCKVKLCVTKGNTCVPSCSGGASRRRRSLRPEYANENPTLITMAWNY